MNKVLMATAALVTTATSALAADISPRYPMVQSMIAAPAPSDWTGFYVGGQIGGATSNANYTLTQPSVVEPVSFNPSSVIGGAHIGVQGQWGSWVLGVEGTYSAIDLHQTVVSAIVPGVFRYVTTRDIETVVGKVGFASGAWMVYAKGGYAEAQIDTSAFNSVFNVSSGENSRQSGYTVGGGVDYMFAKNWIAGLDFNYYEFRFNRNVIASGGGFPSFPVNYTGRDEVYAGMFRLSYLFNYGPIVPRY